MAFVNRGSLSTTVTVSRDPDLSGNWVCDGVADEVQINAAIVYVGALGGGEVKLLEGIFVLAAEITIDVDNIMLMGCGHGTELSQGAADEGIHVLQNRTHIIIMNLQVDGTSTATYCIHFEGASANEITWCRVEGCWIHHSNVRGLSLEYTDKTDVVLNQAVSNVWSGIRLSYCEDCNIVANQSELQTDGAIGNGIRLENNERIRVIGNRCDNNTSYGIEVLASSYCILDGNYCYSNTLDGIETYQMVASIIVANHCHTNTDNGIKLTETSPANIINSNHCYDNTDDGIHIENSNYNQVCGNYLYTNNAFGIHIASGTGNRVFPNTYLANTSGAISDAGTATQLPEIQVPILDDQDANAALSRIGDFVSIELTDAQDVVVAFNFRVPSNFQELVRARIVVVPLGTGNLSRSVATDFGACGQVYTTHSDSIAQGVVAVTLNELECLDINAALDGILAGDHVGVAFTRHGTDVNDTVDANVHVIMFWMQYV